MKLSKQTKVRAYHVPTGEWRWAVLSCTEPFVGDEFQGDIYARVDPAADERLEDFLVHEAKDIDGEKFTVGEFINVPCVYS